MCCCGSNVGMLQLYSETLMTFCRVGQYNSYAFGSNSKAAGSGGQGHSDHHPPALLAPVPDA